MTSSTISWRISTGVTCDVVGGLDAMGFVLGSALATRLGVGFLPIRKAGKLCVDTDKVSFSNYSGRTQDMEMRTPAFAKGTKVLLADQWVETGGTMDGAIRLVERQGGTGRGARRRGDRGECGDGWLPREIPLRLGRHAGQPLAGGMQRAETVELRALQARNGVSRCRADGSLGGRQVEARRLPSEYDGESHASAPDVLPCLFALSLLAVPMATAGLERWPGSAWVMAGAGKRGTGHQLRSRRQGGGHRRLQPLLRGL